MRFDLSAHGASWQIEAAEESHIGRLIAETGRAYEYAMLEHIHAQGFQGTAVDVGAHIGNHSLFLAAACGLRVVAFEPIFVDDLRANIKANGLGKQIVVVPCALGRGPAHAKDSGGRVISGDNGSSEGAIILGRGPLPVKPLDDWALEDVSVIKVDVEGMEPDVLLGGERTIREQEPVLYLEARDKKDHRRIAKVLEPWGYEKTGRFARLTPREEWRHA